MVEICKINKQYKLTVPIEVRNKLDMQIGDYYYCAINDDNTITLKKVDMHDIIGD